MTKEESKILKGIAILFMVFCHLFGFDSEIRQCASLVYINNMPLAQILTRACSPVSFFLILSGYGLYIVETKRTDYDIIQKIKKLYLHYWITLLIFIPFGAYIVGTDKYPGSWQNIFTNIIAWNTTWNASIWFLFPYILLALTSKWIFKLMGKINVWMFMGITLFLSLATGYIISRYGNIFYNNQIAYMPILYIGLLFAFTSGAWMAKYSIIEKFKYIVDSVGINRQWLWLLLALLVAFRCCFDTSVFHTIYAIAFIVLFVNATKWNCVDKFLAEMGKRSTSIWFVHTYFCFYIFHDLIYGFRYPIVILIMLLVFSYMSAVVIDWIKKHLYQFFLY